MKLRKAILLGPALLVLLAGTALAKSAPNPARLDPSFGHKGGTVIFTPPLEGAANGAIIHLAVAPSNKSYVQLATWIFAFGANGKPDRGFGDNGRVTVATKGGALVEVTAEAVDSQGRVLVTGTIEPVPGLKEKTISGEPSLTLGPVAVVEAFVIRYLPNGSLDPTFGSGGEVDTTFGAPRPLGTVERPAEWERPAVRATQIAVDAAGRPVIAAKFVQRVDGCFDKNGVDQAFVTRLNVNGTLDSGFGSSGRTMVPSETSIALAGTPRERLGDALWTGGLRARPERHPDEPLGAHRSRGARVDPRPGPAAAQSIGRRPCGRPSGSHPLHRTKRR